MKQKFTLLIALALIFSASYAQQEKRVRIDTQNTNVAFQKSVNALAPAAPAFCAPLPTMRDNAQLKYINGSISTSVGNSTLTSSTNYYFNGCISFTESQMVNYVGGTLTQISVGLPSTTDLSGSTMTAGKVWIKSSLSGAVVYEQTFTPPTLTSSYVYYDVTLNTPYTITAGSFVIGFTYTIHTGTNGAYALPCSLSPDVYQAGGFNYIVSTTSNSYGSGASWYNFTSDGNLAIIGYLTGVSTLPANDLSALSVTSTPVKWTGHSSAYVVRVSNTGTASQNNYAVQLIDGSDNVLASQNVTTTLAAGASTNITLNYTPTVAGLLSVRGKVILTGDETPANDISEPLTQKIYPIQPMAYCTYSSDGAYGAASNPNTDHAAIGYLAADMTPFVGKQLTSIDMCLPVDPTNLTNCTVWIRNSTTGTDLYSQAFTPTANGWNYVTLTTPYTLTSANTFIGYTVNTVSSAASYPLSYSENTPANANGGNFAISTSWYTLAGQSVTGNMNIIGGVAEEAPTEVTITTNVSPAGSGTVTGGGTYSVGDPVTLTATPESGYSFVNWNTGSTDNPLTFNASVDATYTANFQETEIPCDAITTFPWTEGFEGATFPPDCWTNIDADGDGYAWQNWLIGNDEVTVMPISGHESATAAGSASYLNGVGALHPNNWLITPPLQFPEEGSVELTYWVGAIDAGYPAEHYEVRVSTTGTAMADFTDLLLAETLTASDANWRQVTLDLSAYTGQTIYIAFVHNNTTDQYIMRIDDITVNVTSGVNNNQASNITVYPNPVSTTFVINNAAGSQAKIYDVSGKMVYTAPVTTDNQTVDISNVSAGVYFLELQSSTSKSTVKLIKE